MSDLGNTTKIEDICFAPLSSPFAGAGSADLCAVQSVWGWWENDPDQVTDDLDGNAYLSRVLSCAQSVHLLTYLFANLLAD